MSGVAERIERALRGKSEVERAVGIDRLLREVRTGRFEQTLSALTAVSAVVTGVEVWLEHDRASFGDPWMWTPLAVTPLAAAAGVAGAASRGMAKTFLPLASLAVIANGLQGLYLHLRGVGRRPGGWHMARYNLEMGPPPVAPLLVTMVGGMGLLAAVLRRS